MALDRRDFADFEKIHLIWPEALNFSLGLDERERVVDQDSGWFSRHAFFKSMQISNFSHPRIDFITAAATQDFAVPKISWKNVKLLSQGNRAICNFVNCPSLASDWLAQTSRGRFSSPRLDTLIRPAWLALFTCPSFGRGRKISWGGGRATLLVAVRFRLGVVNEKFHS